MEKKLHINLEFIFAALAVLCALSSLMINILSPALALSGASAIATSILWLVFALMLPVFFLTGNKLFLRLSLILGALLRAVSVINTIIMSIGATGYVLGAMYYILQLTTLTLFVIMAVSACLKEGKTVSLLLKVSTSILLLINVFMLLQMVGTLGYYHLALKCYIILSYATDIFFALALVLYAFRSFAEKKKASYKNAEEALRKLKTQLENGEITDKEYTARKRAILKSI